LLGIVSLGTVSLGTVSLGTVSLGTVSLGTVSLGTVSLEHIEYILFESVYNIFFIYKMNVLNQSKNNKQLI
jgi:hypothetical protein